ncbi:response regulator transcription factor [Streptomyces sp. NBC_01525]|uniref:Response regulator transcription factor n=1 Tax=Streptomyces benahoarensis TaxID=2595054 RepID=A0A553ZQ91_9ACTN|nr:response regulator transcription factor [Streptomyces benahoarensis]TSB31532.1 response regulator transcription factor [Streptomyces benahoarensis]TSB43644.1 response regulator transcription factor [Streptomyces benahoarensis]
MTIRVVIADDQTMIRESFAILLNAQPDIDVVGEADNGEEGVRLVHELDPDIVLMDIRMPRLNGLQATQQITAGGSVAKILVLTTFDLDEYVYEALRAGASGFLLKTSSAHQLANAIRTVHEGGGLIEPTITKRLMEEFARLPIPRRPRQENVGDLTLRETEVLCLIARGLSNAELAKELVIAEQTAKTHVGRILVKLGLRDRTQAAIFAYEAGLVVAGE